MKRFIKSISLIMTLTLWSLLPTSSYADEQIILTGTFSALSGGVQVKGTVNIIQDDLGNDYIELIDFALRGGVILDLKICGDVATGTPFENICVSNAEPPYKTMQKRFKVRSKAFIQYKQVLIFDAEIGDNLAEAELYAPLIETLP
ncbi:MAG: hypothetical protein KBD78_04235 [Oligoflexales bacterium]|nr:hypothetical protein [Oligoflexales bacterium]